jgi:hypothetical protein
LRDPRPDPAANGNDDRAFIVYTNVGNGIIGKELDTFELTGSIGIVTVVV